MGQVHQRLIDLGLAPGAPGILMPQGGLGVLPLHASWREVDGGKRAFWDDYTVTYAPSGYALNISRGRLREEQRQEQSLLAVINPTRDLKYAAQEGEALAALFPQDSVLMFREDTATVVAFFQGAPGRSHVHYSGHGFYDWENFLQSGLLLASSVPFTLNEIITHLDLSSSRPVTLWPARRASPTFNSPPRTNT